MSKRSGRSAGSSRSQSSSSESDTVQDCKAAFLVIFDDLEDEIESKDQLEEVLQQAGRNPTEKMLRKYWSSSTDSLSFDDFVEICRKEPCTSADDLMKAFRKIDTNGDGYISREELYDMMTTRGEKMSMSEVKAIIDEVDENKDGKLDYSEFCNMIVNTASDCKKMSKKIMERKERKKQKMAAKKGDDSPKSQRKYDLTPPKPAARKRGDDRLRSPVASRKVRLSEPRNLKDWMHMFRKGCFFLEDDASIVSHQYMLHLPSDSSVWFTIQPYKVGSDLSDDDTPVDTALYILRDKDTSGHSLVTFTEQRDPKGKYGVRCDLDAGSYILCPMTTGCRLRPRRSEPRTEAKLMKTDKDNKVVLSKTFKKALEDIFEISDLDGNGLLSREEFNLFNLRTSGEEVADDEWNVVEDNVPMKNGQVTKAGFIRLNEMEAEDNDGDTEDSWITLNNMGYNKSLILDEACPFRMDVYVEDCDRARLTVRGLEAASMRLENAVCTSVIQKGESTKVKGVKDLTMYTYIGEARASAVLENKSYRCLEVQLDCSKSKNVVSSKGNLTHTVELPSRSMMVAQHLIPDDESAEWSVKFGDPTLK
ncbi:EF-hand calcium-binding domain-containing protein 7-like [Liolophura sinensis]|uniref:EF-hand calcium-binding domain-containing protein 7-like n=1 Tax=Liolophura sinensis TaxID=3198878 RepID=UPI00315888AD